MGERNYRQVEVEIKTSIVSNCIFHLESESIAKTLTKLLVIEKSCPPSNKLEVIHKY
jgi:hypothetical protein